MHLPTYTFPSANLRAAPPQILLLEDDPIDRELIEATLDQQGIDGQFYYAARRQEFVDYLTTQVPDLILADYILPSFDGMAALNLAQTICPHIPFILVSGVLGEEQAIEALKQGATDYVLKHRLGRLAPAVRRALREHRDRQERQQVTEALQQTDELLRAIVDASPISIITLSQDQRVITWNAAAETLYGWLAAAVVERPLPIVPDRQRSLFNQYFAQALEDQVIASQEIQHVRQDGQHLDISLSLAPLHDADNQIYGVVMTMVDISVRKQVEAQRIRLLEREQAARQTAEAANRVKDEFLAVLSHELRTPLNAIVGWIKLIQRGTLNPAMMQRALDTIERNATAQAQLIEDLLDIARILRGQVKLTIQPVDVAVLIHATMDSIRPAAEAKSISLHQTIAPLECCLADPDRLQQIIWNLLSNAIKFTPAGGSVTIQAAPIDAHLQLQVRDSGIGIAPDFLPHVFDYFRQADGSTTRSQGGVGLGLALTRHLVELHGGTIAAASAGLGEGATFTVQIPMRSTTAPDASLQPLSVES